METKKEIEVETKMEIKVETEADFEGETEATGDFEEIEEEEILEEEDQEPSSHQVLKINAWLVEQFLRTHGANVPFIKGLS